MSVISGYGFDRSVALTRRFVALTWGYFDKPDDAKNNIAQIPLENIFRLLEMYRYNSFKDERRPGVLAFRNFDSRSGYSLDNDVNWYIPIKEALDRSFEEVYSEIEKAKAVEQLQDSLRFLALPNYFVDMDILQRSKKFFEKFDRYLKD